MASTRPLILATLVGATVGVPYLTSKPNGKPAGGAPSSVASVASYSSQPAISATRLPMVSSQPPMLLPAPVTSGSPLNTTPVAMTGTAVSRPALNGTQFTSIDQVLRFDVSKEWVYQNWDRKSTGASDVGLLGVRVPLTMAPQIYALAGSLTYFFNAQGQVEHISFRGRTGDTAQLAQLLTSHYQFQRVASPVGEQNYQVMYNGQVQSELRTHPEAVQWLNTQSQSVAVELELARPGSTRVLPPRPTGFEGLQAAQAQQAQQAAAAQAAASQKSSSAAVSSSSNAFLNNFRYATPQEQSQVIWQRWPR